MILHISPNLVFIHQLVDFLEENLGQTESKYLIFQKNPEKALPQGSHVIPMDYPLSFNKRGFRELRKLISLLNSADKIILHGLHEALTIILLSLMPWNLKKCYWFSMGSEIYKELKPKSWDRYILFLFKKWLVRNVGTVVVELDEEYEKILDVFGSHAQRIKSFKYPTNIFSEPEKEPADASILKIQVGNSADPSNHHLEIFEKLRRLGCDDGSRYEIICPLSYGDTRYAREMEKEGQRLLGDAFNPIMDYLPMDAYKQILSGIDMAIFNHQRQQAMGNIIYHLGMGKKVFIQPETTPWNFFRNLDVALYSTQEINLDPIPEKLKEGNKEKIRKYFSKERLISDYKKMFS